MSTTVYTRNRSRLAGLTSLSAQKVGLRPNDCGVLHWLKADAGCWKDNHVNLCADNDTVNFWDDSSGYGFQFNQSTSGNRPTYKTNIANGLPVVRFNGTTNVMQSQGVTNDPSYGNWITLMFVVIPSTSSPIGIFDSAPSQVNTFRNYNSGQWEWQNAQPQFNLSLANANIVLLEFQAGIYQGTNQRSVSYYRNGALVSTNTGTRLPMAWDAPAIGGINLGSAGYFTGDFCEMLLFGGALSTEYRKAMEVYLMSKWGITG